MKRNSSSIMLLSLIVAALILSVSSSMPVHATSTIDRESIADTYTDYNNPDYNFGSLTYAISSFNNGSHESITYLKFDISTLNLSDTVSSASLNVYCQSAYPPSVSAKVYNCSVDWNETALTWNNQPDLGTEQSSQVTTSNSWISFPVTDIVQTYATEGRDSIAFQIANPTDVGDSWATKENTTYIPYLHIEYTPTPEPTPTPGGNMTGNSTGYWDVCEYGHWKIYDDADHTPGFANYTCESISDFSGYFIDWNLTKLGALLPAWWGEVDGDFNWAFGFTGADNVTLWTNGQFGYHVTWSSGVFGSEVGTYSSWGVGNYWFTGARSKQCEIYVSKNGTDQVVFQIPTYNIDFANYFNTSNGWMIQNAFTGAGSIHNFMWDNKYINITTNVDSGWFSNVTVRLWVGWTGHPDIEAYLNTTQYLGGDTPSLPSLDTGPVWPNPRTWLDDIWDFLTGAFSFIIGIAQLIVGILMKIAPYLPFIAILYIIDLGVESYREGSFEPIGAAFRWLFGMVVQVYDTVIHLGQLIWDAITFWT